MARYAILTAGSHNWSDTATWSSTADGLTTPASVPTSTTDVAISAICDAGATLAIDATANCQNLDFSAAANNPTVSGSSTLNVYGNLTTIAAMVWSYTGSLTFKATSGTKLITTNTLALGCPIVFNGVGGTFQLQDNITTTGNWTLTNGTFDPGLFAVILASNAHTITGTFSFYDLIRTALANGDSLTIASDITVTHTLTLTPLSATARLIVQSSVAGTQRTITSAANVISTGILFMDIKGAGAGSWDLSAIHSGDCGGNTDITFTTPAAQTWDGTTGNWNDATKWTSRVPLPQDSVSVSAGTLTVNMANMCGDFTVTGTPTFSLSQSVSFYGSVTWATGMTWTHNNFQITLRGRGTHTFDFKSLVWYQLNITAPGGTYTAAADATHVNAIFLNNGTLSLANRTFQISYFSSNNSNARTLDLTGCNLLLNYSSTTAAVWNITTSTLMTLTADRSTLTFLNNSANARTFAGGSLTYNNVTWKGNAAYTLTISGSNIFTTLAVDRTQAAKTIATTDLTTQTITNFICPPSGNRVLTLGGTSTGGWAWVKSGGGQISLDYTSISYSTVTPAGTWFAGYHSVDGGNNVGWAFGATPISPVTQISAIPTISAIQVIGGF